MNYDFDPDWFADLVAENIKLGYSILISVFLATMRYPPLADAIVRGITLGGKHEATKSKPQQD